MSAQAGDLIQVDGQEKLVLMTVGTEARLDDGTHVPAATAIVTVPAYLVAAHRMAASKAAAEAAVAQQATYLEQFKL